MSSAPSWIVGSAPSCDVRVDNPTVSGRHCRLTQDGGAYLLEDLQSTNGTFVEDERIDSPRVVRRGEKVTLGQDVLLRWADVPISITVGRSPENDVVIPYDAVSACHARLQREGDHVYLIDLGSTNGTAINDPAEKITRAPLKSSDFVFLGTHRVAASDLIEGLPDSHMHATTALQESRPAELAVAAQERGEPVDQEETPTRYSLYAWLTGIALSLLIVVVLIAALGESESAPTTSRTSPPSLDRPSSTQMQETTAPAETSAVNDQQVDDALVLSASDDEQTPITPATPDDPWAPVLEKLDRSAFLLAIEDPEKNRTWPAATAWAIGENRLLTCGQLVTGLAEAQQRGWTLWAMNEATGAKIEVASLQVHVLFNDASDDPQRQIFFDLGLVHVPDKLSSWIPLASGEDLTKLEPGLPLGCVAVEYDEGPLFRFQSIAAQLIQAKVLDVTPLEPPPAPSLLVFTADLSTKPYGAALVNKRGQLCAIFAESAESDTEPQMYYAPIVDRDIALSTNQQLWVDPLVPPVESSP